MATKKWVDRVRPAVRHFLLSAIPVQKVHKWGRRLGVATDALNTLCLRLITHETLGMILYVSMRCARVIPGGGELSGYEAQKIPPCEGRVNCHGDDSMYGSNVSFLLSIGRDSRCGSVCARSGNVARVKIYLPEQHKTVAKNLRDRGIQFLTSLWLSYLARIGLGAVGPSPQTPG